MMHQALSQDDLKGAQDSAKKLLASLNNVDMKLLEGPCPLGLDERAQINHKQCSTYSRIKEY